MENNIERLSFDLPTDVIFDILSRLPVKTLIRFKSVCKTWYALIENPNFVETHQKIQSRLELNSTFTFSALLVTSKGHENTRKSMLLHFSEASHGLTNLELLNSSNMGSCLVVGICNGLICVIVRRSFDKLKLIVCNPTAKKFRQLPPFKLANGEYDRILLGFGLHFNRYKVIRIIYSASWTNVVICAELYTMYTDKWRKLKVKLGENYEFGDMFWCGPAYLESVIINGVFYWKVLDICGTIFVASFDISKETFSVIEAPLVNWKVECSQLLVMKEELVFINYHSDKSFELLKLDENTVWTMINKVDLGVIPSYPSNWGGRIRVLGCTRNGELILENWYEDNLKLLSYDLIDEEIKCLHSVDFEGAIDEAYLYTESLTPVN